MSQNQSFFWQTSRHNVYLKRSAKLHMLLALLAVLTYATICVAEVGPDFSEDNGLAIGNPTKLSPAEKQFEKAEDVANELPNNDAAVKDKSKQSGFVDAFTASISVILFTELGDKTFFIAAIMAMRHPRLIVFVGAISALALMTVLSVVFGMAATIIPKIYTYYISTALFAIFGLKMIYEGYFMKATDAQEELEEVQSDLRKREDELLRSKRTKYDDNEAKRKNSNSDKEDGECVNRGAGAGASSGSTIGNSSSAVNNPEMEQRQRKQRSYHNNSNKNNNNNNNANKQNECDLNNTKAIAATADTEDSGSDSVEHESFLQKTVGKGGATATGATAAAGGESMKMSTFHSSPGLSSIASNETNQTHCDGSPMSSKFNYKVADDGANNAKNSTATSTAMVHSSTATGNLNKSASKHSINSISGVSSNSAAAAGQQNGELKQLGGSKKRLERDVTATLVQDPESGVVRKSGKKGATYLTTRVLMQAFTMTFLAEWGDRSQLTTIILAASKNVYGVIAGGVIGHSICTGLAVIGGRMVAAKISVRTVTIVGGVVFLGFALYALIVRPDDI